MLRKQIVLNFWPVLDMAEDYAKACLNKKNSERELDDAFLRYGAKSDEWKTARAQFNYWCRELAGIDYAIACVYRLTGLNLYTMISFARIVRKRRLDPRDVCNRDVWRKKYYTCEKLFGYLFDAQS